MFTTKELEILKNLIINYPIQGSLQTLPEIMQTLFDIIKKIDAELEKQNGTK